MATLKISDLSVGDWVEYEGLHYPITFVGYGEGGDGSLVNLIRPDLSCFTCKISDIYPIPITAEILEGNGFICKDFEKLRRWECGDVAVVRDKYEDALWCVCENADKFCFDIDVRHIHQLQHALRLAGVDKEINL